MKIVSFVVVLAVMVAGLYFGLSQKTIFEDEDQLMAMVDQIRLKEGKNLSKEEIAFLDEFPKHKALRVSHIWTLLDAIRDNKERQNNYLALAQMYKDNNFTFHASKSVDAVAAEGSNLSTLKKHVLAAEYFAHACETGDKYHFKPEAIADWAFFTGYNYENGQQLDLAIKWYKKTIELDNKDYRPHSRLGMIYYQMAKQSSGQQHKSHETSLYVRQARKHIFLSLDLNKEQKQLHAVLDDLRLLDFQNLSQINNRSNPGNQPGGFPSQIPGGVDIQNPVPQINLPKVPIPQPGIQPQQNTPKRR